MVIWSHCICTGSAPEISHSHPTTNRQKLSREFKCINDKLVHEPFSILSLSIPSGVLVGMLHWLLLH